MCIRSATWSLCVAKHSVLQVCIYNSNKRQQIHLMVLFHDNRDSQYKIQFENDKSTPTATTNRHKYLLFVFSIYHNAVHHPYLTSNSSNIPNYFTYLILLLVLANWSYFSVDHCRLGLCPRKISHNSDLWGLLARFL